MHYFDSLIPTLFIPKITILEHNDHNNYKEMVLSYYIVK